MYCVYYDIHMSNLKLKTRLKLNVTVLFRSPGSASPGTFERLGMKEMMEAAIFSLLRNLASKTLASRTKGSLETGLMGLPV